MIRNLLLLFIPFFFFSCGNDRVPLFTMDMEANFIIEASHGVGVTRDYIIPNVNTFFSSYSENTPEALARIETINPSRCFIRGRFQNYNFNFIDEISISIVDPSDPSTVTEIFYLDFIDLNEKDELDFFPGLLDVKDIVKNELTTLIVSVRLRNFAPGNVESNIDISLTAFEPE